MIDFDYEGARNAGYTDKEIQDYLKKEGKNQPKYESVQPEDSAFTKIAKNFKNFFGNLSHPVEREAPREEVSMSEGINPRLLKKFPDFDVEGALSAGYTPEEVNEYFEENQPKRSKLEKAGRLGAQYGLGLLEGSAPGMVYDIATAPIGSKSAMGQAYRETLLDDLERLREQKELGTWDDKDQQLYDHLLEQVENPEKAQEYVQAPDVSIRGLAEKATGLDLHPEGVLEKSAQILGLIKNPKSLKSSGLNKSGIVRSLFPSFKELPRGLAAGAALELAEQNQMGPGATLTAAILGDMAGAGVVKGAELITHPKRTLAQVVNLVTGSSKRRETVKQLVDDFNKSGLKIDAGTLTNSPLIQSIQARLAQSGLTGRAFENARKDLSQQVVREYENIANNVGQMAFENNYQASEAIKDALRVSENKLKIPTTQGEPGRSLEGRISIEKQPEYQKNLLNKISPTEFKSDAQAGQDLKTAAEDIKRPVKEAFDKRWSDFNQIFNEERPIMLEEPVRESLSNRLRNFVYDHEGSLLMGESAPEARVLKSARSLLEDLNSGKMVTLKNLIKTKRTLQDIANWEFGGSDFLSAYKGLSGDVSNAIEQTLGIYNPQILEQYQQLNAEYAAFKDMFENRNVKSLFEPKNLNYNAIHREFTSNPDKLRSLEDIFYASPRGEKLINEVKRDYAGNVTSKKDLTPRDIQNLSNVLGPQFNEALEEFGVQRKYTLEHPLPRIKQQKPLKRGPSPLPSKAKPLAPGRVSETGTKAAQENVRRKYYNYLSGKSPEQIMKKLDTVKGIREFKRVLELTPEGKKLFKDLARFKLAEMIDSKMMDAIKENVKLGTFSKLLKTSKDKALVKELIGKEPYSRLELLQRNSGRLVESAEKFYNASKSGSSLIDAGLIGTAMTGVLTGNLFLAIPSAAKVGGSTMLARLIFNDKFIKELQKAILTNDPIKFEHYMRNMTPYIHKAMEESRRIEKEE